MAKLVPTSTKYVIKAKIKAKGIIEKPDVIGAVFGQTEGLLGSGLDLRELQRTGRIGRIEVNINSSQGNSSGEIIIPSSLDSAETALIAATLETIERVGPCIAEIILESVEDTRATKRKYVVEKAKEILKNIMDSGIPDSTEVSEQIKEAVRTHEISSYHGLPCGPNLTNSDDVIIVEGRADVINLLKYGIRNTVAIEGTSIPPIMIDLAKEKVVTLFIDGDRGGQLIAREIIQKCDTDYVATAPTGKEVEELSKKEVYKALREKISSEQFKSEINHEIKPEVKEYRKSHKEFKKPERIDVKPKERDFFKKTLEELVGTRAACILNSKNEILGKVPVTELHNTIKTIDDIHTIVFDGRVDYKLNFIAKQRGVKFIVGMEKENISSPVTLLCRKDLEESGNESES